MPTPETHRPRVTNRTRPTLHPEPGAVTVPSRATGVAHGRFADGRTSRAVPEPGATRRKGIAMEQLHVDGGTLAYEDRGEGPLVILVPGMGDLRQEYRFLAPDLVEAGHRVVSVDLRGHGGSSVRWRDYSRKAVASDLLALIDHLDAGPATLVCNSFTAASGVWAASERPEAVAGLVLIGPFVLPQPARPVMRVLMRVLFTGPWKVAAWSWYFGTLFPTRKPADFAAYRAALRANLAEAGRFEALRAMMLGSEPEIADRLAEVRSPSLVVMGSKDPDFGDPVDEARRLADGLGAEVVLVDGAGHYPHSEMPEETAAPILHFLKATRRGA
jgi:pimeloyl-ACP methyl ester carboxylesterase